ncbi:MAG: TetR/AcrR family transcriptional regulator, partial [Cyanobacteria bacterium J06648_11]
ASRPELDLPDPVATARVVIGTMVYHVLTQKILHGDELIPIDRDRVIDTLIHLILSTQRS